MEEPKWYQESLRISREAKLVHYCTGPINHWWLWLKWNTIMWWHRVTNKYGR